MKINTYLNFAGNAEEAFMFYKSVFGGEFRAITRFKDMPMPGMTVPKKDENKLMHIALPVGKDDVLMASDVLEGFGHKVIPGNNITVSIFPDSKEEADRIFNVLSIGGKIEMPLGNQPWEITMATLRTSSECAGWLITYIRKRNKGLARHDNNKEYRSCKRAPDKTGSRESEGRWLMN